MQIAPILSTLRRHKTATLLIVLQVAVACAILCNAVFLVSERSARMLQPSGIDEYQLVMVTSMGLDADTPQSVRVAEDLAVLRAVPGVEVAENVGQFPFADSSWQTGVSVAENQEKPTATPSLVTAGDGYQRVAGLQMLRGRWFNTDEFQDADIFSGGLELKFPVLVITEALAQRLFPGEDALGKMLYGMGSGGSRIIGISRNMLAPGGSPGHAPDAYGVLFVPARSDMSWYVLRTTPEQRGTVLNAAVDALNVSNPNRIIGRQRTLEEMRSTYYSRDRAVVWLLLAVSIAMLAITAFGIGGLASFWVQQRTRQIGVRRALGATRGEILRYFQTENFLIVTGGIVLGMLLAFGINQWLMGKYELPRLPWQYLPIGALLLLLLGQLAVLWPALRAASIPPATATRSV